MLKRPKKLYCFVSSNIMNTSIIGKTCLVITIKIFNYNSYPINLYQSFKRKTQTNITLTQNQDN